MKVSIKSFLSLKNRILAWNKYLRIGATATLVGLISLSVMLLALPNTKQVTLSPAKQTAKQNQKAEQGAVSAATTGATEGTTGQTAQGPNISGNTEPQATAKSTAAPTAPATRPRDTSTELPKAVIRPMDPNAPSPFYEIVIGSGAINGDSVNIAFYVIPHNHPAADTSASIMWIDPQGQAPDYVYVRDIHMTSATTGVFTLGLSGNYPHSFTAYLTVSSNNTIGTKSVPINL